jgi:hypothetical protein
MAIVTQQQQHAVGPGVDTGWGDAIKLDKTYPLISSPLTPDAIAYNEKIKELIGRWWKVIGAPYDNSQKSDPDTDYQMSCLPGGGVVDDGFDNDDNGGTPNQDQMLPGVISMTCFAYISLHGGAHGEGQEWGFNWLVAQQRPLKPDDVFRPNAEWLGAITAISNADRGDAPSYAPKLDLADRHHWVVGATGLGLAYTMGYLSGYVEGGAGGFYIIPWSKLHPYLNPHGIVPKADWNATLPTLAT